MLTENCKVFKDTPTSNGSSHPATVRWRQRMWDEGKCLNCGKDKEKEELHKQLCYLCNLKKAPKSKAATKRIKLATFEKYGGAFCSCCNISIIEFLSLDHINNDGYKEKIGGRSLYYKLKRLGYPPGYRVLCHNCNLGRYINGGVCPHVNQG